MGRRKTVNDLADKVKSGGNGLGVDRGVDTSKVGESNFCEARDTVECRTLEALLTDATLAEKPFAGWKIGVAAGRRRRTASVLFNPSSYNRYQSSFGCVRATESRPPEEEGHPHRTRVQYGVGERLHAPQRPPSEKRASDQTNDSRDRYTIQLDVRSEQLIRERGSEGSFCAFPASPALSIRISLGPLPLPYIWQSIPGGGLVAVRMQS